MSLVDSIKLLGKADKLVRTLPTRAAITADEAAAGAILVGGNFGSLVFGENRELIVCRSARAVIPAGKLKAGTTTTFIVNEWSSGKREKDTAERITLIVQAVPKPLTVNPPVSTFQPAASGVKWTGPKSVQWLANKFGGLYRVEAGQRERLAGIAAEIGELSNVVALNGGSLTIEDVRHTAGGIVAATGGEELIVRNCVGYAPPHEYWLANFDKPLKRLLLDNSGITAPIRQGVHQAAIRLMQIDSAEMIGRHCADGDKPTYTVVGSKADGKWIKQAVQDRSGGEHYWRDFHIDGLVDLGWMKDADIAPEQLKLSHWKNCTMAGLSFAWMQPGTRVVLENCVVNGVKTTHQWSF